MSLESVKRYLAQWGREGDVQEFPVSSATVELAAAALGVESGCIAKTLSFVKGDGCLLIVAAGNARIDNSKFKETFGFKAKMLTPEQVIERTGHAIGGVCPFDLPEGVKVYLDKSLGAFKTVYPACGSSNSAIGLTNEELSEYAHNSKLVDVCKIRE